MSDKIIRKLIETRINGWATTNNIVVVYENVLTPKTYPYVSVTLLPAETESPDLQGEYHVYMGLINFVIVEKSDVGSGSTDTIIDQLRTLFPVNDELVDVTGLTVVVYRPISKGKSVPSDNEFSTPVRCAYRCDYI